MLRITLLMALLGAVLLLTGGRERKAPTNETNDTTDKTVVAAEHSPDDGHDHADDVEGEAHTEDDGHDPDEVSHDDGDTDGGHLHGGESHELGSQEIAGLTVEVVQFGVATGNVAQLVFEISVKGEPAPTAIRLLVRGADGAESLKSKAKKVGDHKYDAHVGELPSKLGEGSVLVVEVETPSGTEELIFPLKI